MRFGIVVFPGTWSDRDCYHVIDQVFHQPVEYVWHESTDLSRYDCVVLPGGFSYGDYLRAGAIARFAPVMRAVEAFAARGGLVYGICNGFQILCEAGLLPGALLVNASLRFVCRDVPVRVERAEVPFTSRCRVGDRLVLPVKHADGRFFAPPELLARLEANRQIVLRYESGSNPNGAAADIAGVCNATGNVLGLMPHPEHAVDPLLGSTDGALLLGSLVEAARERTSIAAV